MFVSATLLVWGWWFYILSRLCFWAANTYITFISSFILVPLGYQPLMALKQVASTGATDPPGQLRLSHCQALPSTRAEAGGCVADFEHRCMQVQAVSSHQQESLQRWFADCTTYGVGSFHRHSSSVTDAGVQGKNGPHRTVSCSAAAAAMAICGQSGMSADAAAAAVGAAAMLAQQLSSTASSDSSRQSSQRNSSCCTVPPLMFEVSDEVQRELDATAPSEFLCPLSRVLMTDPVCTPSGFTYQRSYIEAHIAKSGHDPARDLSLDAKQLYPNIVLRDQIATWLQKHGVET